MNDNELLTLAAKAAGYDLIVLRGGELGIRSGEGNDYWNPLEDDGDAFRLAVTLGVDILRDEDSVSVSFCVHEADRMYGTNNNFYFADFDDDAFKATRRAIVAAAAAEIEKHKDKP